MWQEMLLGQRTVYADEEETREASKTGAAVRIRTPCCPFRGPLPPGNALVLAPFKEGPLCGAGESRTHLSRASSVFDASDDTIRPFGLRTPAGLDFRRSTREGTYFEGVPCGTFPWHSRERGPTMIQYEVNGPLTVEEFVSVLESSTLAERRPIDDRGCLEEMLRHANLTITARSKGKVVGVARSVTDYSYCCYLSDLAVDLAFQRSGIGRELLKRTRNELGPRCRIILLSAPAAVDYYPHLGFEKHPQAWTLPPDARIL